MSSLSPAIGRDVKILGLVCFPHSLSHFYYVALTAMFPTLMVVFHLNALEVGLIMTAFTLTAMVGQTPVGFLVDRVGGRHVLAFGLVVEGTAICAMGLVEAYWQFFPLAILAGLGHTVFHPANYAIMSSAISEQRMGRAFSIHSFTGYLGFAVAPLFMIEIKNAASWHMSFYMAGSLGVIAAALLWINGGLLGNASRPDPSRQGVKPAKEPLSLRDGLSLLVSVPILMCFFYFILHQLGGGGVRTFLMVALGDLYGTSERIASTALTCLMIGTAAGILSGGIVADRFGPRVSTAFFTLVPSGLLVALVGITDLPTLGLFAVVTLSGFLMGLLIPSRDLLLRSVTPPGSMGKVMGFASTGANFGGAMVPVIVGYCMVAWGAEWVFWISALFIGAAFLTFVTVGGRYGAKGSVKRGEEA